MLFSECSNYVDWCTGIDRFLISRVRNLDKNLAVRLCITVNIRTARLALVRSTVRNRIIPSDRGACIACPTVVLTSLNKWAEINVIWFFQRPDVQSRFQHTMKLKTFSFRVT